VADAALLIYSSSDLCSATWITWCIVIVSTVKYLQRFSGSASHPVSWVLRPMIKTSFWCFYLLVSCCQLYIGQRACTALLFHCMTPSCFRSYTPPSITC